MNTDGIYASEVKVEVFQDSDADIIKSVVNAWLDEYKTNKIYYISFQQSDVFTAFIVYKEATKPPASSGNATDKVRVQRG